MDLKQLILVTGTTAALGALSHQANAAITVFEDFDGNDCIGVFGGQTETGITECAITIDDVEISPAIAKVEADQSTGEITKVDVNDLLYPSIDGSEFSISYTDPTYRGTWSYSGTAPDPNVKFWAVKSPGIGPGQRSGFRLFWTVDDAEVLPGGACELSTFNEDCLTAAQNVFSGEWETFNGEPLAHLTFYNSGIVPVPAAAWLFGSGLLGLVGLARRRRVKQ